MNMTNIYLENFGISIKLLKYIILMSEKTQEIETVDYSVHGVKFLAALCLRTR